MSILETAQKNRAVNRSESSEIQDRRQAGYRRAMGSTGFKYMNENIQGLEGHNPEAVEGEEEKAAAVKIFQEWWKWGKGTRIY